MPSTLKRTSIRRKPQPWRTRRQRAALKRIGKKGKENQKANATLAKTFKGAQFCEARFPHDCTGSEQLTWAHNMKRRKQPDLLHAALICVNAHNIIEVLPPEDMKRIVDGIIDNRTNRECEAA